MIVVAAASGRLGRQVAAELARRVDPASVTLAARRPQALQAEAAAGFRTAAADYDDRASLEGAFAGADCVLVISSTGPAATRLRHHRNAIDAAAAAGARRIVLTSSSGARRDSRNLWSATVNAPSEEHLKASGVPWTVLRNAQYATNLDTPLAVAAQHGVLAMPQPQAKVAYVGHRDLGEAAAAVLTAGDHEGRVYELTGREALDAHDVAAMLARAKGRAIAVEAVSGQAYADFLRGEGWPEHVVGPILTMYEAAADGDYAAVTDDIARLIGRPPASIERHVAGFA